MTQSVYLGLVVSIKHLVQSVILVVQLSAIHLATSPIVLVYATDKISKIAMMSFIENIYIIINLDLFFIKLLY